MHFDNDSWNLEASNRSSVETAIVNYLRKKAKLYRGSNDEAAKLLFDVADEIELGEYEK